jgi:hypothetical protein
LTMIGLPGTSFPLCGLTVRKLTQDLLWPLRVISPHGHTEGGLGRTPTQMVTVEPVFKRAPPVGL